jgi:hypothetical protein
VPDACKDAHRVSAEDGRNVRITVSPANQTVGEIEHALGMIETGDVRAVLSSLLRRSWEQVSAEWRRTVDRLIL